MYCSISGVAPREPVLSKTGYIFERRLIEELIQQTGQCPVTNQPLSENDLTDIKVNRIVKPRTVGNTSIPAMLQTFQNEFDALMLETYELRSQLDQVRLELAGALYKQDAAERTIARLIRERDHAREIARQKGSSRGQEEEDRGGVTAMDVEESSPSVFSADQTERISTAGESLIAARKVRSVPSSTAKSNEVGLLKETQSHSVLPSSGKGLSSVARHSAGALAIGGADGTVVLWENGKTVSTLKGHSKAISAVRFAPGSSGAYGTVLSASHDGSVRVWSASSGHAYASSHTFAKLHSAEVTGLTVHPCGSFFASASRDTSWSLVDLLSNTPVYTVPGGPSVGPCSAAVFHPDGFLLATATEDASHLLRLWDITTRENVISFPGHSGRINSIAFNENGFYLATGSADRTVKMWDLRNLNEPMFASEASESAVTSVQFDHSGEYLAAATGSDVQLYHVKTPVPGPLEHLNRLLGHTGLVSDLVWGQNAKSVITVSADKTLKIFA